MRGMQLAGLHTLPSQCLHHLRGSGSGACNNAQLRSIDGGDGDLRQVFDAADSLFLSLAAMTGMPASGPIWI